MLLIRTSPSPAPRVPWEIIERVADHCVDSTGTLYSLILTCSNLRPRGTIVLFSHVKPRNRDQLFALCAVLQANPHLRPCVKSVSIPAPEFSPHPFLRMLPNLYEINFYYNAADRVTKKCLVAFHPSVVKYCRRFGQHIHTLTFHNMTFSSPSALSDILLSLSNIRSLSCSALSVKEDCPDQGLIPRRSLNRLHLTSLTIQDDVGKSLLNLLREAAICTATILVCALDVESDDPAAVCEYLEQKFLGAPSDWATLTSLTWTGPVNMDRHKRDITLGNITAVTKNFRPPNLRSLTVEFRFSSFGEFLRFASKRSTRKLYAQWEKTLIKLPLPTILFSAYALSSIQCDLWMHQLEGLFPALAERRALKVVAVKYSALAGHNALMVSPIATSSDSRWAATGASDGTIIVWDLQSGCISQQWYAVENGPDSLAFSPNGQYLMSASRWAAARGKAATIWDLHQDARQMISLEAEAGPSLRSPQCINCIWAPDGSWIAAGAQEEGTVRIWETTTGAFQRRHETVWEGSELLAASADGRWIVTGVLDPRDRYFYHCWIRSVESGQVRRTLRGHTGQVNAAAFNSEGTRVVTGSADSTIRIWDAESGEQLLVMQDRGRDRGLDAVAFSADGRMVLSHAYGFQRGSDCGDGGVKVWDASNGALLASLVEARTEYYTTPHTACFSPCGRYIASASDGATVRLWRTSDLTCIAEVSGWSGVGEVSWEKAGVTNVAFSPDGMVLCWGNEVGMVLFRRMQDIIL